MRHWLLTSTTYGTWLPGDARGFVSSVRDRRIGDGDTATRIEHDQFGSEYDCDLPNLKTHSFDQLKGEVAVLTVEHAQVVLNQFIETARYRNWQLLAVSIMWNHIHLVVELDGDPDPDKVLADFKAYASRALNRHFGKPMSDRWWTIKGSTRKLPDELAVRTAIEYVLHKQPNPLVTWSPDLGEPGT